MIEPTRHFWYLGNQQFSNDTSNEEAQAIIDAFVYMLAKAGGAGKGLEVGVLAGEAKAYQGVRNLAADFNNGTKLGKHFLDHGGNFGYKTAEEYLNGARNFIMKNPTKTTKSFVSQGGTYFRYDTATKEFGIVNQYGGISTYYKPSTGLAYWIDQVNKYAP